MSEQQSVYTVDPDTTSIYPQVDQQSNASNREHEEAQHVIDAVCQRLALAGVDAFDISVYRGRLENAFYGIGKQ